VDTAAANAIVADVASKHDVGFIIPAASSIYLVKYFSETKTKRKNSP